MDKLKKPPFIIPAPKEVISSTYDHISDYEYKPRIIVDEQGKKIYQKLDLPPQKPNIKAGHTEVLISKFPHETDPYERQECIERYEDLCNKVKVPVPFKCPLRHKAQLKQMTKEAVNQYGKKVVMNNLSKLQKSAKPNQKEQISVLMQRASTLFTTRQQKQNNGFDKKIFQRIDQWKSKLQGITQKQTEELEQSKVSFHKHRQILKTQQREQQLKIQQKKVDLSIQHDNKQPLKTATPLNLNKINNEMKIENKPRINSSQTPKSNKSQNIKQSPKQQVKQCSPLLIKKQKSLSNNGRSRQGTEEEHKTNQYTEERKSQGKDYQSNKSEERKSDKSQNKQQVKFIKPRIDRMQSAKLNQSNGQKESQGKKERPSSAGRNIPLQKPINWKEIKDASQKLKQHKEQEQQQCSQELNQPQETIQCTVTVVESKKSRFRSGPKSQGNQKEIPQHQVPPIPQVSESVVNMGLVNVNQIKQAPIEQTLDTIQFSSNEQMQKEKQLRLSQMASTNSLVYKQDLNSLKDSLISESLLVSQFKESSMKENQQNNVKESQLIQSSINDQESITLSESQVTVQPVVKKRRFVSRQE